MQPVPKMSNKETFLLSSFPTQRLAQDGGIKRSLPCSYKCQYSMDLSCVLEGQHCERHAHRKKAKWSNGEHSMADIGIWCTCKRLVNTTYCVPSTMVKIWRHKQGDLNHSGELETYVLYHRSDLPEYFAHVGRQFQREV